MVWFSERLLNWWGVNKRNFPWRETNDPYELLSAELLLRKTTAKQVLNIYPKFVSKYPTPSKLAGADESQLRKLITPLGIENRRADLLRNFATYIVIEYDGEIPKNKKRIMRIPGVGEYSANAVLCFIYEKELPVVDTNYIRIMDRFFGIV